MTDRDGPEVSGSRPTWSWGRLARIGVLVALGLALIDGLLVSRERRVESEAWSGELKNAPGPAIADATRFMLLESSAAKRQSAVAVVGSSITFGPDLAPDETLTAQLAQSLSRTGVSRPVFNLAQPGGNPRTSVPIAAAFGTHPVSLLLVEVFVPAFGDHEGAPLPPLSSDELALIEVASPRQTELLRQAGLLPRWSERVETGLVTAVRKRWRLYRLRGSLWWDPEFTPPYLVWSVRRAVAEAGFLPKRFHGQTTNVGRLPWRKAYVGGERPGENQRIHLLSERISEPDYGELRLTAELAREAGVPLVFFEVPVNLAFQRAFNLMDEKDFARLDQLRNLLIDRMAADGLDFLPAPELPEDAFLDRAHLTPLGAQILAQHIGDSIRQDLSTQLDSAGRH